MLSAKTAFLQLASFGMAFGVAAASPPDGSTGATVSRPAVPLAAAATKRHLVTYVSSITKAPRSAGAISLVNDAGVDCGVKVDYFTGFGPAAPVCSLTAVIPSGFAYDFCSRNLPVNFTTCNVTCSVPLIFFEGKAVISTDAGQACSRIRVSARQYYTTGTISDTGVAGVNSVSVAGP